MSPNGSDKIGGNASATLIHEGQSVTLVYVDATEGWNSTRFNYQCRGNHFMTATGGTITTCGDYKIHTFTGPGTFTVCHVGNQQDQIQ